MKSIKLTKKMMQNYNNLMRGVGAVKGNEAFPSNVYLNPKDCKIIKENVRKAFKKEIPCLNKRGLDYAVESEALNLSPISNIAIKEGYALVDNDAFESNE